MNNSERFLSAFSQIEQFLKDKVPRERHRSFYQLVELVGTTELAVKQFEMDLKEYADLRNAIIHEHAGGVVIAEPNDYAVKDIECIAALIQTPPAVVPLFESDITELKENNTIALAVNMIYERSISQIPIRKESTITGLLTSNTISRWLGAQNKEKAIDLATPISTVLRFTEEASNLTLISAGATVFDALDLFHRWEHEGKRLDAILITNTGKRDEKIIGIITISDLGTAYRVVSNPGKAPGNSKHVPLA